MLPEVGKQSRPRGYFCGEEPQGWALCNQEGGYLPRTWHHMEAWMGGGNQVPYSALPLRLSQVKQCFVT